MKSDRARPRSHSKSSPIPASPAPTEIVDGHFAVASNLRPGVARVDIPPSEVRGFTVVGHRREVNGVRDRLRAAVLILDNGSMKAAIVTLDVIGAWEDMVRAARERIEMESGVP